MRVAARQEPGEFRGRRLQCRQGIRPKQPKIVGMRAAMPALVGHKSPRWLKFEIRSTKSETNWKFEREKIPNACSELLNFLL